MEKFNSSVVRKYFKEGGLVPERLLLHQFLFWLADCSEGKIYLASHTLSKASANINVSVSIVKRNCDTLFSAFNY